MRKKYEDDFGNVLVNCSANLKNGDEKMRLRVKKGKKMKDERLCINGETVSLVAHFTVKQEDKKTRR